MSVPVAIAGRHRRRDRLVPVGAAHELETLLVADLDPEAVLLALEAAGAAKCVVQVPGAKGR